MSLKAIYFLSESLSSFRKNWVMSMAAVVTVAVSLILVGGFALFAAMMGNLIESMERKVEIVVYLKDAAPPEAVDALQQEILSWPAVRQLNYVSKDQALERLRKDLRDQPEMLENIQSNPLPASIEVRLEDPHKVNAVAARLKGRPEVDDIRYGRQWVEKLFMVTARVRWIGIAFIILLSFASLVLISNTIRLAIYARRREIAIMQLVGASNWFIRWPFLLEGILQGLVGALVAVLMIYVFNTSVMGRATEVLSFLQLGFGQSIFLQIVFGLILAGILIGAAGSAVALRRFLKV